MVKHNASNHQNNNASSLFFNNNNNQHQAEDDAAGMKKKNNITNNASQHHAADCCDKDPDFIELVCQLKMTANKVPLKKQWKRKKAHWSSEKINTWWVRALDCAKETSNNNRNEHFQTEQQSASRQGSSDPHIQQQQQEMIQALSDAVVAAQLGGEEDKNKKDVVELYREIVREKKIMFRKQYKTFISKIDFKSLWKSVYVKVAEIHGINIFVNNRPNNNNSEQQQQQQPQGTRKPPPEVANAVAAAAKAATAKDNTGTDDNNNNDALAGPPIKKRKKIAEQQQLQQPQPGLGAYSSTVPTRAVAASIDSQNISSISSTFRWAKVESHNNIYDNQVGTTIVIDDDSDDYDDAHLLQQQQNQQQQSKQPLTHEELQFQRMVQEIDDESALERHLPLQVILKRNRSTWEKHLVEQGPIHTRLSKSAFAKQWEHVEQVACENWHQRIQNSTSTKNSSNVAPTDWSFLVFGKHYNAKKAHEYFDGWDTMTKVVEGKSYDL